MSLTVNKNPVNLLFVRARSIGKARNPSVGKELKIIIYPQHLIYIFSLYFPFIINEISTILYKKKWPRPLTAVNLTTAKCCHYFRGLGTLHSKLYGDSTNSFSTQSSCRQLSVSRYQRPDITKMFSARKS